MSNRCNTCFLECESFELLKAHYVSDLHVFNNKRRAQQLRPATPEDFAQLQQTIQSRQLAASQQAKNVAEKTKGKKGKEQLTTANVATKVQQKTIEAEVETQAEKETPVESSVVEKKKAAKMTLDGKVAGQGDEEEEEEEGDDDMEVEEAARPTPPLGATISLFDNKEFRTVEACLQHMVNSFGFFIPDSEYLDDLEGLLEYLGEKIKLGGTCLYCQRKFRSGFACQNHMINKSHCKLAYEENVDLEELEDFYDFAASYEDVDDDEEDDAVAEVSPTTGELVLPDGRTLGHREFRRYYKQYYRAPDDRPSVLAQQREQLLKLGFKNQDPQHSSTDLIAALTDVQVQAALVKHMKAMRKTQIAEQKGMMRRIIADQKREYNNKVDAARSSATTTKKIRDYHGTIM